MLQPHTKKGQNLTPEKLVKFEWEKGEEVKDVEKQRKRAEFIAKKYDVINKKNG